MNSILGRSARIAAATAAAVTLAWATAGAAGPTFLAWGACRGAPTASAAAVFDCNPTAASGYVLVGTFGLADSLKGAYAMEANLDLTFPGVSAVPAFWEISQAGCNATGLVTIKNPPDDCSGHASAFCAGDTTLCDILYSSASIRGPNTLRLAFTVSRARADSVDLAPLPDRYHGFSLFLLMGNAGLCSGCLEPVAIVWNTGYLFSVDLNGQDRPVVGVDSGDPMAEPCAAVNGGASACGATPVRSRTWGALKALYR